MSAAKKLLAAADPARAVTYVEDVFLTHWSLSGGAATIAGGPELSAGGLVVIKNGGGTNGWRWTDTARGVTKSLDSSSNAAEATETGGVTSFNPDGYTVGSDTDYNGLNYSSYSFKENYRFFKPLTVSHTNGAPTNIDLSLLVTVGFSIVKNVSTGDWWVWHRSLTASNNLRLNTTAAQSTTDAHLSVSGTTLTIASGMPTGTYVVYGMAHDTAADGMIQCGSYTTDGSGNATVTLGWEVQFVLHKASSATSDWRTNEIRRDMSVDSDAEALRVNLADVSATSGAQARPHARGFAVTGAAASTTYVYVAVRRPNRPPTSGTQVYNAIGRVGNATGNTAVTGAGFPPDVVMFRGRDGTYPSGIAGRLRLARRALYTSNTNAEATSGGVNDFNMDGMRVSSGTNINDNAINYINHFLRRAPGFMDEVPDTETVAAARWVDHSLEVAPEMMIRKTRSVSGEWKVWHSSIPITNRLVLNSDAAKVSDSFAWGGEMPTATQFRVGTTLGASNPYPVGATCVTWLFATLPGVSKVGSYTGNGTSLTVNCGFAAGARLLLIKRTDAVGDWYLFDTVRGIVAGNDPHLSLNTTVAEVTTDDSIDPDSTGFIVNQNATTNLNVNGAAYAYLAIA